MNDLESRREFLKQAAVLPLGAVMAGARAESGSLRGSSKASRDPDLGPKIKTSVNAWSYNVPLFRYVDGESDGMSLFDLLEECAQLDVDAVDPTGYFFPGYPEVPDPAFVRAFRRRAFDLGLSFSGTGIRNDFAQADAAAREADLLLARRWIEAAAELGAPVLRVFAGEKPDGHSWEEAASWLAESLSRCAEYGEEFGVIVGVQNHGGMLTSADEVLTILDMVQSEWLGAIVDTGYFLTEDPYEDVARVLPHAVNWQVKEFLHNREGGEIDLERLVGVICDGGYRGYVPIETLPRPGEAEEYDAYVRVPRFLEQFRSALRSCSG